MSCIMLLLQYTKSFDFLRFNYMIWMYAMKQFLLIFYVAVLSLESFAAKLPSVFSDNMVLQRGKRVPVWGKGAPGEKVTVEFAGQKKSATTGKDGRWQVELNKLPASRQNQEMTVSGKNIIRIKNVLVGDVWLCAGQTNMQSSLHGITGGKNLVAAANNPAIRLLKVPRTWSRKPQSDQKSTWQQCTPKTAKGFPAVGYIVGRELGKKTGTPIGLIGIAWGGCRIEAMTARESYREAKVNPAQIKGFEKSLAKMDKTPDDKLRRDKQRLPSVLFNAMVHPLTPFVVRGMIWYQGEDNHSEGMKYAEKLKALAYCWRTYFSNPNLPVFLVLLPPFKYGRDNPEKLPNFWKAQMAFADSDKNSGYIVTTDCGNPKDIHPKNKLPLGLRLANLILLKEYKIGDDSALSPTFAGAIAKGDSVVIKFNHSNGLKTSDGKSVSFLELAGKDGKFHPATGKIVNNTLIVSSPEVRAPEQVRFGWHKIAEPNFVNRQGVPVAPFSAKF